MNISPDIACKTCITAADPQYQRCIDLKCPACCVRHIMLEIEVFGKYGDESHEGRIKDALFEELLKWREGEAVR